MFLMLTNKPEEKKDDKLLKDDAAKNAENIYSNDD